MYCTINENTIYIRDSFNILSILTFCEPVISAYLTGSSSGYVKTSSGNQYELEIDSSGYASYYPIY